MKARRARKATAGRATLPQSVHICQQYRLELATLSGKERPDLAFFTCRTTLPGLFPPETASACGRGCGRCRGRVLGPRVCQMIRDMSQSQAQARSLEMCNPAQRAAGNGIAWCTTEGREQGVCAGPPRSRSVRSGGGTRLAIGFPPLWSFPAYDFFSSAATSLEPLRLGVY